MKNGLSIILTLLLLACSGPSTTTQNISSAESQEQKVDQFMHSGHAVSVYFKDPLLHLTSYNSEFMNLSPREQAEALSDFLHNNAVYRFEIKGQNNEPIAHIVLEGEPDITDSAAFYRIAKYVFDQSDMKNIGVERTGVRGMLFEHMAPFQTEEGQKYVGNGIALFEGIFMRVTPYSEVKKAVLPYITQIVN